MLISLATLQNQEKKTQAQQNLQNKKIKYSGTMEKGAVFCMLFKG